MRLLLPVTLAVALTITAAVSLVRGAVTSADPLPRGEEDISFNMAVMRPALPESVCRLERVRMDDNGMLQIRGGMLKI
ncbi:hypothetical protein SAMN05216548_101265 [Faunimonas pinastri]|uniref:Uncharacterized protein n=1 Tax=Faunimonas pinastri TaxID=1855383 RepID=A0A1H8ZZ00_9HYPH|nr:hypothetical protein [Faunimonas pinastri]SEP68968.1 hypothetical protein SAMN05216548_101265 [Faunimonas pinastri]